MLADPHPDCHSIVGLQHAADVAARWGTSAPDGRDHAREASRTRAARNGKGGGERGRVTLPRATASPWESSWLASWTDHIM